MLDETTHYGLLKTLEDNPGLSQRDLAKRLGVSLGKVNFCLNALVEKGSAIGEMVKHHDFLEYIAEMREVRE